jgi:phosphoglucosamine mutase
MISASHNPYQYNGIKIFGGDGFKLSDAMEDEIEALIGRPHNSAEGGKLTQFDSAIDEYAEYIIASFGISLEGLNIGIDCANGSSSVTAERIFTGLGANCTVISDKPNGTNINLNCGSTHLENLIQLVKDQNLDLGLAFDGDADRCLAIDRSGNVIDGDFIMAIIGLWLRERGELKDNTIVGTIMSNLGLRKFCEKNGLNFFATKVGDRYVLEKMNECGYDIGGEQSGHLILGRYATTGDGQLTAVALLSRVKESGKDLSDLAAIMRKYPQYMVNITANSREKELFKTDEVILSHIAWGEELLRDGGRLVIRPSGTEPLIRIMAEGEELSEITDICNSLAEKITARLLELKATVGE